MLIHWQMRPTTVESGSEALILLEQAHQGGAPFPLVLLDAQMPGMDGFAVAEQLKNRPHLTGGSILMVSSDTQIETRGRCREVGIDSYLRKPIIRAELWDAIRTVLIRPERQANQTGTFSGNPHLPPTLDVPTARPLHILLAEDNPVNQRLVVRLLEKQGHTTFVTNTGREALAALTQHAVDVVLMDVQMPDMDGLEATTHIRAQERSTGAHVPIIALTAYAMKGDRERCLAAGMDGYLAKPIHAQDLWAAIVRVLTDRPHSRLRSPT
jgi:two-component system sensor histidine kinase/response regulator